MPNAGVHWVLWVEDEDEDPGTRMVRQGEGIIGMR